MLIQTDENLDTILIEFEAGTAGYAEELDDDRVVDSTKATPSAFVCTTRARASVSKDCHSQRR